MDRRAARGHRGRARDHRAAGDRPAGVHARRHRRRHRRDGARLPRARPGRPARQPDRPGHGREVPGRLAGDRVRGDARRRRHVHRRVLDGERGSARRPYGRFDRRGAGPDADRRRPPATAERGPRDHPGARGRGWLQRPVRPVARLDRVRRDRGQPARVAELGARVEGDGLPDRPGRGADRGRAAAGRDPERGHRDDRRRLRTRSRLRRGQAAAVPVRQVPRRRPLAGQPDEGDRRGDGHRPDVRVGSQQGAPRPRAGGCRAARRGRRLDAHLRLPGRRLRRRPRRGRADPLGGRGRSGLQIDPPRPAQRGPDRPAPVPRPVGQPAVAAARAAATGCSGGDRRRGDRDLAVVPRGDGPQRRTRGGGERGRTPGSRTRPTPTRPRSWPRPSVPGSAIASWPDWPARPRTRSGRPG